jgi:hypothetical protein
MAKWIFDGARRKWDCNDPGVFLTVQTDLAIQHIRAGWQVGREAGQLRPNRGQRGLLLRAIRPLFDDVQSMMFCFKPLKVHVTFLKRKISTPASILAGLDVPVKTA